MFYDDLLPVLGKAVTDAPFRNTLLSNPTATLKASGVDIGHAVIDCQWVESTNILNIHVKNGGANWTGGVHLKLEK